MPSTRYEAKIAAGTESGLGEYTRNWVEASTNISNCKGKKYDSYLKPKVLLLDEVRVKY